jgi:flagellin FlaB
MLKIMRIMYRNERGITGLETAIILIAFVVVASVFAYTVLSAGIFSSQKAKEAIYSGLDEATSSMEPRGGITAYSGTVGATETVVKVSFTVTTALPGYAADLTPPYTASDTDLTDSGMENVCLVSYIDDNQLILDAAWTVDFIGKNNGDHLLDADEQAVITVWLVNYAASSYMTGTDETDPFIDAEADMLKVHDSFTIEVRGEKGAILCMERTVPGRLDPIMNLN